VPKAELNQMNASSRQGSSEGRVRRCGEEEGKGGSAAAGSVIFILAGGSRRPPEVKKTAAKTGGGRVRRNDVMWNIQEPRFRK
jgi:hypothetical protein